MIIIREALFSQIGISAAYVKLSPGSFNVHGVLIAKLPAQLRPVAHRPHDDDSYYAIMTAKEFLPLGYLKRQRLI